MYMTCSRVKHFYHGLERRRLLQLNNDGLATQVLQMSLLMSPRATLSRCMLAATGNGEKMAICMVVVAVGAPLSCTTKL